MRILLLLTASLFLVSCSVSAQAPVRNGKDYAVFFYVTSFKPGWQGLPTTKTEAEQLSKELESNYGFICRSVPNPTRQQIFDTLSAWNTRIGPNDQVLFFFSAHGYYDPASKLGYLIAADGVYRDDYFRSWLDYNSLRPYFARCKAKNILVALDACHSGSFGNIEKGDPGGPAYNKDLDCQTQVERAFKYGGRLYVCSGNEDARTPGESRFAAKFLELLRKGAPNPGGIIHFDDLHYALGKLTSPEPVHGDFTGHQAGGDFVFVRKDACVAVAHASAQPLDPESKAWDVVRNQNTEEAYRFYLDTWTSGRFRAEATQALHRFQEERVWQAAVQSGSKTAYEQYKASYCPGGLHCAEAVEKAKVTEATDDGLVFVKGGSFTMGCTGEQKDCEDDESVHTVTLNDFYIGRYEVTQRLWKQVMGNNPSYFKDCDDCPVEQVSWNDIQEFLAKLNRQTGLRYRLPTEAEWEYAARGGGKQVLFGNGKNTIDPSEINFNASSQFRKPYSVTGIYRQKTLPVGSLNSPNVLGLHDMSGNVYEWCSDWYGSDYYENSPSYNPSGPSSGSLRVLRGGAWGGWPQICRVADRSSVLPDFRSGITGFRLARTK